MRNTEIMLDTHILLWMIFGDEQLSQKARMLIKQNIGRIYYSIASMWEVQIKYMLGKMPISGIEFMHYCEQSGYHKLPIDDLHVVELAGLVRDEDAPPHNDPFDRIMISQAKAEGFLFLSHDSMLGAYHEPCVIQV